MCGIVGYIGSKNNCLQVLIEGLKRLEYRGYDSSGIAYLKDNEILIKKESGKLENLIKKINFKEESSLGIGHTRWATHGAAEARNAHPHRKGKITVVHNGIIENYHCLKNDLFCKGYIFESETDTEVVSALLDYLYSNNKNIVECLKILKDKLEGSYALGIICDDYKNSLFVMKKNSPLIIGVNKDEKFIASDVPAILDKTNEYIVLEDGDYAEISKDKIELFSNGEKKEYNIKKFEFDISSMDKQGYEHYMLKEIFEQPEVFKKTVGSILNEKNGLLENIPDFSKYNKFRIVACGSAAHAGLVGKQLIEQIGNKKVEVNIASEFRYDKVFLDKDELVIAISQSGETADTLEAVKIANSYGIDTLGIINEKGSSISRECKYVIYTEAGKEIAVATTKAYSAQVTVLSLIAISLVKDNINKIIEETKYIPNYMFELLDNIDEYMEVSEYLKNHNDIFYIGRGIDYAISMEGSLKLKEISYKHCEAYAAGELKHGTISLIEEGTPVIAIVTDENRASKTISNIKEVKARGAYVIYVTNRDYDEDTTFYDKKIVIPKTLECFSPLLTVIPLQLIAYEVAKLCGCDIDKPRNLAKSVTVE